MDAQTPPANNRPHLFQEIISEKPEPIDLLPFEVEAYISKVEPKKCGKLIKELSYLLPLIKFDDKLCSTCETTGEKGYPWPVLGHLRRVSRIKKDDDLNPPATTITTNPKENYEDGDDNYGDSGNEPPKKRKKTKNKNVSSNFELEVLIGSVLQIDSILDEHNKKECTTRTKLNELITMNQLRLEKRKLPGRPAKSQTELDSWKLSWWPSLYFEKQSVEYRDKEKILDIDDEWGFMRNSLLDAIDDAKKYINEGGMDGFRGYGAVAVDPISQKVVSRSYDEWRIKVQEGDGDEHSVKELLLENPLNTPVMLCIQGVSRIERQAAMGEGMDSDAFKQGQYLCTGYDVYCTKEPGIFESMALVHSRVGRVIFGAENDEEGGLGGTGSETSVHSLPGTNHRYRVFRCCSNHANWLVESCQELFK